MIVYYSFQFKEDDIWHNDPISSLLIVEQKEAHLLIELMELGDDARLIRLNKSEAMENDFGEILWLKLFSNHWEAYRY